MEKIINMEKVLNIVQVKHEGNDKRYTFAVPLDVELNKGDMVLVSTSYGDVMAKCVTDSSHLPDKIIDMIMEGKEVTGTVVGKYEYKSFDLEIGF